MLDIERRQDRLDDALERLTNVSMDLKQIVAVFEQRITQNEKNIVTLFNLYENRRAEYDNKIKEYDKKLEDYKKELKEHYTKNSNKISQLERFIWMAIGGGIALSWLLSYVVKIGAKLM